MPQPASTRVEAVVIDVLKDVSRRPIEPASGDDLVVDLGFDSLQLLEVIGELENRFDISIPQDELRATRTVEQIVAEMTRLTNVRGGP
jgi:acyl carrier protein